MSLALEPPQTRTVWAQAIEAIGIPILRRVLRRCLAVGFRGRQGSEKLRRGSKKELSRRHFEGRNTPCREYDPLSVRVASCESVPVFLLLEP